MTSISHVSFVFTRGRYRNKKDKIDQTCFHQSISTSYPNEDPLTLQLIIFYNGLKFTFDLF